MTSSVATAFETYLRNNLHFVVAEETNEYRAHYDAALLAVREVTSQRAERLGRVEAFLREFNVLQGFSKAKREALAACVLGWCDDQTEAPGSYGKIVAAHQKLSTKLQSAYGGKRRFTSFASKALWLKYPDRVPIYDRFAFGALAMLARLEGQAPLPPIAPEAGDDRYPTFVSYWQAAFADCEGVIKEALHQLPAEGRPHACKVFDAALWELGRNF